MSNAPHAHWTRRAALGAVALPWLAGCATPLPLVPAPAGALRDPAAVARLQDSAEAHGLAAYRQLSDINVSYEGQWRPIVDKLQPELVDAGFRGPSQERLLPRAGVVAQASTGPKGRKQVWWQRGVSTEVGNLGDVTVWFNGVPGTDLAARQTAALVAEGYGLFLLGPLWLVGRPLALQLDGTTLVEGRLCDVVSVWLSPGLGMVALDRLALCIDRQDAVMRRVRFTLEGFDNTQGAVAEVDAYDHQRRHGVLWPTRWHERLLRPLPLPVHDWHLTGLDVNRGCTPQDLAGPAFTGAAAAPAARF
jgi:hypothetical protein